MENESFTLEIEDMAGEIKAYATGEEEVFLCYTKAYEKGDAICIRTGQTHVPVFVWVSFDDALGSSLLYLKGDVRYEIPFELKKSNLSPKVFSGERHLLSIKKAQEFEINSYRNLAVNVCDQHEMKHLYPHASANVETRNEADFEAKNAIDGNTLNLSHGAWPYGSWGINQRADATFTLDFGREILTDQIVLYTRADFDHDNYWTHARITFSDETFLEVEMDKSIRPHVFSFDRKKTSRITLSHLIPSNDPSLFPALTQIQVYGVEATK